MGGLRGKKLVLLHRESKGDIGGKRTIISEKKKEGRHKICFRKRPAGKKKKKNVD